MFATVAGSVIADLDAAVVYTAIAIEIVLHRAFHRPAFGEDTLGGRLELGCAAALRGAAPANEDLAVLTHHRHRHSGIGEEALQALRFFICVAPDTFGLRDSMLRSALAPFDNATLPRMPHGSDCGW